MAQSLEENLAEIDTLILHGSVTEARARLEEIYRRKIPRAQLVRVANLTRRVYLAPKSVQLLHRFVRPAPHSPVVATDRERAEYASALIEIGGPREARKLLAKVDATRLPIAWLFEAYTWFWEWDWEPAIPCLRKLIEHPGTAEDIRIWGQTHLGASLMQARREYAAAGTIFREVLERTRPDHFRMVHKNTILLLLQNEYFQKRHAEARKCLARARATCMNGDDPFYALIADQWDCLIDLQEGIKPAAALGKLHAIRAKFVEDRRWENVRACDLYEALALGDRPMMIRLYYGTPHSAFRRLLLEGLGSVDAVPADLDWALPPFQAASGGKTLVLEVANGRNSFNPDFLKEGQVPQKLLQTLASDFYKPMQVAELHERVYPDQYFDPGSSPDRIHQAIRRLRGWFKRHRMPVDVEESDGLYRLISTGPCVLRIHRPGEGGVVPRKTPTAKAQLQLQKIQKKTGASEFTAVDAAAALAISYRSSIRVLNEALKHGVIERLDTGSKTRYRFK